MVEPESRGRVFHRVLVVVDLTDLRLRQDAENAMPRLSAPRVSAQSVDNVVCDPICREELPSAPTVDSAAHTVFIPAHTILFPGRSFTGAELASILREHRIDATLVLAPTSAGSTDTYVPPSYQTNCGTWNSVTSCASSPVGGGVVKKPWATFAARLFDARDARTVWIATATSNGNAFASYSTLLESMAKKTLEGLRRDGMVQ